MSEPFQRLRRFLAELKRRNVYEVAATYAVVGFVLIQVADLTFVRLGLPSWTVTFVIVLIAIGFPLALVLAWAFERTPEGMRRTSETESTREEAGEPGKEVATGYKILLGLGLVGAAVAGGWYLTGGGGGENPEISDRSVAVLPFEALGEEEPGTFTEGMHSDLQTKLSNIAGLTVTSSRSVERYRGSEERTAAVARELGVGWIVSGDVQRMGDQIQVNVRLVDPEADVQAWTDSYRRDLTAENLFAIQTDITREVARALEAELTPEETERVEREPTQSLEAHRLYAQGRRLLLSRRPDSLRRAIDRFERAIEQDSNYALAWAGLADARMLHASYTSSPETFADSMAAALPEAELAIRRALKLDPDLAEGHASWGLFYRYEQRLPEGGSNGPVALRHLRRAVELKPSYAEAHHWLGGLLLELGRPDRALEHLRLAVELSPENNSAQLQLPVALVANTQYKGALSEARRLQQVFPDSRFVAAEALALAHLKRWEQLRALAEEYRNETDDPPYWTVFYPALADAAVRDTTAAQSRIEKLRSMGDEFQAALVHAALGELDLAFQRLPEPENWPAGHVRYVYRDLLPAFRADPRYEERIRRLNEYLGLNPDGSLPDSVDVSFGSQVQ